MSFLKRSPDFMTKVFIMMAIIIFAALTVLYFAYRDPFYAFHGDSEQELKAFLAESDNFEVNNGIGIENFSDIFDNLPK